ncbi:pilus assembly protein [uncultured Litoreibacter sp.]|uniref:pilus assembly protein n=1 Tax=uncultured Litoreibacter sp. TaxID=1392394 RepID=UPI00261ABCE7|nr:pilus assembly protein [uncultured Litoreibacter sp.]
MLNWIKSFALEEDGAVTVDWVILSAGVISLALAAVGVITDGTEDISGDVDSKLKSQLISTSFESDDSV